MKTQRRRLRQMLASAKCLHSNAIVALEEADKTEASQGAAKAVLEAAEASYHNVKTLLDIGRIRNGEAEPLTDSEEDIYDALPTLLRFDDKLFATVTEAQRFSAARVINRQGDHTKVGMGIIHPVAYTGDKEDMLGIGFAHIFIGIEPDGYAHS